MWTGALEGWSSVGSEDMLCLGAQETAAYDDRDGRSCAPKFDTFALFREAELNRDKHLAAF
jgi:hypothetical protein